MTFITDFEDKAREIDKFFEFVVLIENINHIENVKILSNIKTPILGTNRMLLRNKIEADGRYIITQELRKILKATSYLLLYNIVEGSINAALNEYFNAFSTKKEKYKKLKPEIQSVWLRYKYNLFLKNQPRDIVTILSQIFEDVIEILPHNIQRNGVEVSVTDYHAYSSKTGSTDVSGNIDARKIRDLAHLYGFLLPANDTCNSLLTIKNKRNNLAHGEISFTDAGRESLESIIEAKEETIKFLRSVLIKIKQSIQSEVFIVK